MSRLESTMPFPLQPWIEAFLTDLKNANRSPHTRRAYAADLGRLAAFYQGSPEKITVAHLRAFLETFNHLKPATRARKQAALNSFFTWAYRHDLISANPMGKIEAVKRERPTIHALTRAEVEKYSPWFRLNSSGTGCYFNCCLKQGCG